MNQRPSTCAACPLDASARGFALDRGSPESAKLMLILEAPGRDEITIDLLSDNPWPLSREDAAAEVERRRASFPNLPAAFLRRGAPTVGATWAVLANWILPKAGIHPYELFIANVLRCLPPKGKENEHYPTGDTRTQAETACRQYDRMAAFAPDVAVVTLHPASLLRDITPLSLVVEDFRKVASFIRQGLRPMVLCGGKAAFAFLRHGSNVTRFRGHYVYLPAWYKDEYKQLFGKQIDRIATQLDMFAEAQP